MNILGINFGHDASATFIKDGKIVFSIEEEKMSRVKQDVGWPSQAIEACFEQQKIGPDDVDIIAIGSLIYKDLGSGEIKYRFTKEKSDKWQEYVDRIVAYGGIKTDRFAEKNKKLFEKALQKKAFSHAKLIFYKHHLCHAASAWYCSPFVPDLAITCDGHGDGESFNFYYLDRSEGLKTLKVNDYKSSVGAFYSSITQLLGFRPTRHEGKITGLAAFGKHSPLVDHFYNLFRWNESSNIERFPFHKTEHYWNLYNINNSLKLSERINLTTSEGNVGTDYTKRYAVLLERVRELSRSYTKEDIACAAQQVAEKIVLEEIQQILNDHFKDKPVKVALAGGVFANVRINQKIYELPQVENIYIQPAMGDSGLSLGAAILADIEFAERSKTTTQYRFQHTYLGPDYSHEVHSFLKGIGNDYLIEEMENPPQRIAQLLRENLIVGFWHGSMEWGPRALGKRSMILNTFDKHVNDSLNKRLHRTEFMPFAPSVIDFMVKTYMPAYDESCPAGDYMTITYDVVQQYHDLLQAVVHVDGTARPQVVSKQTNPYFYQIIEEFYKLTGCGAIVNTSFNVHEEPIVSTPQSAFNALRDDRIDALVLERYLIRKRDEQRTK